MNKTKCRLLQMSLVVLSVFVTVSISSCKKTTPKAKSRSVSTIATKECKPEYLLGDSIKSLLSDKTILYNTQPGTKYSLSNKILGGVTFEQVDINCSMEQSDVVRSVCYASGVLNKEMNTKYNQMLNYLKSNYGEPSKEVSSYSDDRVAKYTRAFWNKDIYAISIFSTVPLQEESGSMIVIFTIPDDICIFRVFFQ